MNRKIYLSGVFIYLFILNSVAIASSYMSFDELRLDNPKPGTSVTLNFMGCSISDDSSELSLKCGFRKYTGLQYIHLYVSKAEAKSILANSGYQSIACKLREISSSSVSCSTLSDDATSVNAPAQEGNPPLKQPSKSVGWVFTKLKSDHAYERFSSCSKVNTSFEGHLKSESNMWSSRGAVCSTSKFFDDTQYIFECRYPALGNSTRYYFWHDSKAKCEARLKTVKERWEKEKWD